MIKALVTGGGGFLGSYIVKQLLDRGDSVSIFARGNYQEVIDIGAKQIRGDIRDSQSINNACKNVNAVFHVASLTNFWGSWKAFYGINVIGTENIINACIKQRVKKLIYTSSPNVIFDNKDHKNFNETYPYPKKYDNYYGKTKAIAEQKVIQANNGTLNTVALRPHAIWGPGDDKLLPRILKTANDGKLIQIGDGSNIIDITYVEDAARAHLLAADALEPESPVAGSKYFISQDDPINLWPWLNQLFKKLNFPPVKKKISLSKARALASILEFFYRSFAIKKEPILTRTIASALALNHYYDISKAKKDFNYYPKFSMEKALDKTLSYLKID